jgi:predicted PurR-regulated permease PerM
MENTENSQKHSPHPGDRRSREGNDFLRRVLIVFGAGVVFLLLMALIWFASGTLLLVFSSILVAILLHDACSAIERWIALPRGVVLAIVLLLAIALFALAGWLLAPQVADQINQLTVQLPDAWQRLLEFLYRDPVLQRVLNNLPQPEEILKAPVSILTQAGNVFSGVFGGLASFVVVLFLSIYLSVQPQLYIGGVIKLLPPKRRQRGRAVLHEIGVTLSLWLRGKLLSMAIIGIMTAIGLGLLGVPLALLIGIITGLLDFIPYVGPVLGAIPALLMAFSNGPMLALYVLILYLLLQSFEGYVLLPLVERKTVSLPPALTITVQLVMGLAFGLPGVALASPFTAMVMVLIEMLYVQEVLEEPVELPAKQE